MIDKTGFGRTTPTNLIARFALLLALGVMPAIGAAAQPGPASFEPSPHAIDIPLWF